MSTILVVHRDRVLDVLRVFNSVNEHIQFTHEVETDGRLPFLGMLVIRDVNDGSITTDWYRKPIASGRLLNYKSYHPLNQKMSTAKGFMDRVLRLSSKCYQVKNRQVIVDTLRANEYPSSVINRHKENHRAELLSHTNRHRTATN